MNTVLGDKLSAALESKKNDINNFMWKGPRKFVNGKRVQEEFKLMDATEEQLKKCYAHCKSMLYSKDKEDPGRYELINILRDQQLRCTAELYIRYLRKNGTTPLEFRAVHMLKNDRYENLSEMALITLSNKVLFRLEDEARNQAQLWEQKMEEIEKVAEKKGYKLD
jgi:hypothetical protein